MPLKMHHYKPMSLCPNPTVKKIRTETSFSSQKKPIGMQTPKTPTFQMPYQYGRQTGHRDHDLMKNVERQRTPHVLK